MGPLSYPDFRNVAGGRFVTMLGNAMAPIALSFAVIDLTHSASDLGLVVGARSLVNVLFLLFGGVLADRLPRQLVVVGSSVLAALTQGAVAALVLTGQATIPLLVGLSALNGMVSALAMPATAAIVSQTVPTELLQQANALNRLGQNAAMIVGAPVGGLLSGLVSPGWGLAFDATTFAICAVLFARVKVANVSSTKRSHPLRDLHEGWREFIGRAWLWQVVLGFTFINAAHAGAIGVLGPLVADQTFGRPAWGLILAAVTVGMALGALLALKLKVRYLLRLGCICMVGELPIVLGLAEAPYLAVLLPAALLGGLAVEQFGVAWESSMQLYVPSDVLARVYSYDALGSFLAIPIGQAIAGPLALTWGVRPTLLMFAGVMVVGLVVMLASRDVRMLPSTPPAVPTQALAQDPVKAGAH